MPRKILSPPTVHKPTTYYSHAIAFEEVVYLAGQAPHDLTGAVIPPENPEGQVRQVFENMKAVLEAAEADFGQVARMSVLVRRADIFPIFWKVARQYLGEHCPAVTAAVVKGLAGADYLVEIDAIVAADFSKEK